MTTFATIQLATYTEAEWTAWGGVLKEGQHAYSSDLLYSGTNQMRYKVGNGVDVWTDLDYVPEGSASSSFPIATAGGTADAITATYTPALTLTDKMLCAVVLSGANTITNPTFAPDGLTAHTITKNGGQALVVGDLPGALAVVILEYNLANTRWEIVGIQGDTLLTEGALINSATSKATPVDADYVGLMDSATANILKKLSWANIKATLITTWKDVSGGFVGLTLLKINFKNTADTFTSFLVNTNTASRTYTFQDRDGTIADLSDTTNMLIGFGACTSTSLADSSNYYIGTQVSVGTTVTENFRKFRFAQNQTITKVQVSVLISGVIPTNENLTFALRKNATTDSNISTTVDLSGLTLNVTTVFEYTVSIDVDSGADYEFKMVTSAFATNPTGVRLDIKFFGKNR